jgi:hypothetical protein
MLIAYYGWLHYREWDYTVNEVMKADVWRNDSRSLSDKILALMSVENEATRKLDEYWQTAVQYFQNAL